jgi:hypothetical protein
MYDKMEEELVMCGLDGARRLGWSGLGGDGGGFGGVKGRRMS